MNLFRNLKITHQFLIVFGILILGFAAIGLAYKRVLDVEETSASVLAQTNAFGSLIGRAARDIAAMSAAEKGFMLSHDLQYVEDFEALIGTVQQRVSNLERQAPDEKAQSLVVQMRQGVDAYTSAFNELVDATVLQGLDQNKGLHGEMRAAVHAAEDVVRGLGEIELVASMLQMRRHEKDFIQRADRKYIRKMAEEHATFVNLLNSLPEETMSAVVKDGVRETMSTYQQTVQAYIDGAERVDAKVDDLQTELLVLEPLMESLLQQNDLVVKGVANTVSAERTQTTTLFVSALIAVAAIIALVLLLLVRRMQGSLARLNDTVQKVGEGDVAARSQLVSGDELGELGRAFDNLLDERVAIQAGVEKENEQLNESIIGLMISVAQLSQKDLTVKAAVAEDVTGPVSDAVNLMASETSAVLRRIREISEQVEQAASTVRAQADKVTAVATEERQLVQASADELMQAGETMASLALGAEEANEAAGMAMEQTRNARQAVSTTVGGIEQIREIIRETEKRIKRLGERSQEITGAVNLINTIAERTHILALNASMHAASAGEAGRGFAVVADEVQRLAESSREATSDISSMVNAIRVETADTVDTMNRVISQVAEGTRLAQEAGERMEETETTTADLVSSVDKIAAAAERQARTALELMQRSKAILESTEQTSRELEEQSAHTDNLVDYSKTLRSSVSVFKLPDAA